MKGIFMLAKLQVLLVDDEEIMREIVVEKLAGMSIMRTTEAASVAEAKTHLMSNKQFDLIISDYQMPGGHGGELLSYLYEKNFKLPFILLTNTMYPELPATDEHFLGIVEKLNLSKLEELVVKRCRVLA
jgi:CheY-like chemotaxis protein